MKLKELSTNKIIKELESRIKKLKKIHSKKKEEIRMLNLEINIANIQLNNTLNKKEIPENIKNSPITSSILTYLQNQPEKAGSSHTTKELFSSLKKIAIEKEFDLFPNNVKSFSKQLRNIEKDIESVITIIRRKGRSRETIWSLRIRTKNNDKRDSLRLQAC